MDTNSRIQKLERLQVASKLDLYKTKLVRLFEGQISSQLEVNFNARDNSTALIILQLDNAVAIDIKVNSICIYSGTTTHAVVSANLFDLNKLNVTISSSAFCTLSIVGDIQYSNHYPHLICLNNNLIGVFDKKYYVNDISTPNLGNFNIYNNNNDLADVYDFTSINEGGNNLKYYTYFDTNEIVVHNLDSGVNVSIVATQPLGLSVMPAGVDYDYVVCALYKGSIKFYTMLGGVVADEFEIDTFGITKISSVVGVTTQSFLCIKSGVVCLASVDLANLKITFKQLAMGSDIQCYEHSNKLYLISLSEYTLVFKIFDATDYSLSVSKKFNNISGTFVKADKLYAVANGMLQVIYE